MKKLKVIGRIVLIIFVSLIVGINVYLWNARSLMGNALPMPLGYGAAVVLTGSMEPTISGNDLILVAEADEFAVDDVVVYQSGSILVVHRIIAIDGDTVTTQGDANQAADEPIDISRIKGCVIGVVPGVGALVKIMKTPAATIFLIIGAVVLMEMSFRKEKQKDIDELEKIKEEIRKLREEQE